MRVMPVRWAILCNSPWAFTQGPRKLSGHVAFCEADIAQDMVAQLQQGGQAAAFASRTDADG